MLGAFLLHDAFLAEMVEPLLCHVRSQAEEDAQDASGDVTVLLEILLDFRQQLFLCILCGLACVF